VKGREGLTEACLHIAHRDVEGVNLRQVKTQEESVMQGHAPRNAAMTARREAFSRP
jgi:hypothetical protein